MSLSCVTEAITLGGGWSLEEMGAIDVWFAYACGYRLC